MAQMLAMVCRIHQKNWDAYLPYVKCTYNNSVSMATGLAPNEEYIVRLPCPPFTAFDRLYGGAYQSLDHDQVVYLDLTREHQQPLLRTRARLTRPPRRSSNRVKPLPIRRPPPSPQMCCW